MKRIFALVALIPLLCFGAAAPNSISIQQVNSSGTGMATRQFPPASGTEFETLAQFNTALGLGTGSTPVFTGVVGNTTLTLAGASSGPAVTIGSGASGTYVFSLPGGATQNAEFQSSSGNAQFRVGDSTDGLFFGGQGQFHARRQDGNATIRLVTVTNGGSQNYLALDASGGTFASPTALLSGRVFGSVVGVGNYGDVSAMAHGPMIDLLTTENWSNTNRGSAVAIKSVAVGTTSQILGLTVSGTSVTVGQSAPAYARGYFDVVTGSNANLRVRYNTDLSIEGVVDSGASFANLRIEGGALAFNPVLGGNITMGKTTTTVTFPGISVGSVQALSGAGAVDVITETTALTTTGVAQALTLANGANGQTKIIKHVVDGGSAILTPTTKTGFSTITFTNVGETVTLHYTTTGGWFVLSSYGAVVAP